MRKQFTSLTGLIYLIILCFSATQLRAQNETEDNGSLALANNIIQGATMNASIGSADLNDYFYSLPNNDGTIALF